MRTAQLTPGGRFEIGTLEDPQIRRPEDVLIRVDAVGVCGSDLHYFRTGRIGDQVIKRTMTPGHECAGTVLEAGAGVRGVRPGDTVVVEPAISCGTCDQCRSGRAHTCRRLQFLGCPGQRDGALSERLVLPEANCFLFPASLPPEVAVLAEPVSIALWALHLSGDVRNRRVTIQGAGPIGLSVLACARDAGAAHIHVTEPLPHRRQLAVALGAKHVSDPQTFRTDAEEEYDVVYECCGQESAWVQAADQLRPGGQLMIVGIPESDRVTWPIHELRRKEITVRHVRRQNGMLQRAVDLVAGDPDRFRPLITHRFSLQHSQQAFETASAYRDGVVKAVILPSFKT